MSLRPVGAGEGAGEGVGYLSIHPIPPGLVSGSCYTECREPTYWRVYRYIYQFLLR